MVACRMQVYLPPRDLWSPPLSLYLHDDNKAALLSFVVILALHLTSGAPRNHHAATTPDYTHKRISQKQHNSDRGMQWCKMSPYLRGTVHQGPKTQSKHSGNWPASASKYEKTLQGRTQPIRNENSSSHARIFFHSHLSHQGVNTTCFTTEKELKIQNCTLKKMTHGKVMHSFLQKIWHS